MVFVEIFLFSVNFFGGARELIKVFIVFNFKRLCQHYFGLNERLDSN